MKMRFGVVKAGLQKIGNVEVLGSTDQTGYRCAGQRTGSWSAKKKD